MLTANKANSFAKFFVATFRTARATEQTMEDIASPWCRRETAK